MTHYVLIDDYTGYVWGDAEAADPVAACRIVDERLGEGGRAYAIVRGRFPGHGPGYHVHKAPADWQMPADATGIDPSLIATVDGFPLAAHVACFGGDL